MAQPLSNCYRRERKDFNVRRPFQLTDPIPIDRTGGEPKDGTLKTEQGVLRISIAVTILLAGIGILFGLLSGSYAIVFDGIYGLTDAAMTMVALFVSKLIESSTASGPARSKLVKHFTMGSGISSPWFSA